MRKLPASNSPNEQSVASIDGAMSVEEFCRSYCVGRTKLYSEAKAGKIRLRKLGSKTLIARADAEAWLQSLPTA